MSLETVESYWTAELGEPVEIVAVGWVDYPSEYALHISGTHVVAFKRLEEVEDFLDSYFVRTGKES